jgi:cyanate permease
VSGIVLLAAGSAAVSASAILASSMGMRGDAPLLVAVVAVGGFIALGAGAGLAYGACLLALTRDATPTQQGVTASRYAAVTYAVAAATVLAVGRIAEAAGLWQAMVGALALLSALALASLAWAPRLIDTVEPPGRPSERAPSVRLRSEDDLV